MQELFKLVTRVLLLIFMNMCLLVMLSEGQIEVAQLEHIER